MGELYEHFEKHIVAMLHRFFQRLERERTPSSFYEVLITWVTKLHKYSRRKKNYSPILLTSVVNKTSGQNTTRSVVS